MLDRSLSALIAVGLAVLVWLYARSRDQEMLDNVPIPVQVELATDQAAQYRVEMTGPSQVPVSFAGSPSRIRELRGMLQRGDLRLNVPISVPPECVGQSRYLATLRVDPGQLQMPPGLTVLIPEDRNRISVALHRLVDRRLPVRFDPGGDDHLRAATLDPAFVWVRGPQDVLDRVREMPTQPICPCATGDPVAQEKATTASVPLVNELEGCPVSATPEIVQVRWAPSPRRKQITVTAPVHFLCPTGFSLRPRLLEGVQSVTVTLNLSGPAGQERLNVWAYIDLTKRTFDSGTYREPVHVQLPMEFQLDQEPPGPIAFELLSVGMPVESMAPSQGEP